jgi:hypothetical protein
MIIEIITAQIKIHPYMKDGIQDKRFRSGYRVAPMPSTALIIHFIIKRIPELRLRQTVQLFQEWGTYIVVTDNVMTDTQEIIPVRSDYQVDKFEITIPKNIIGSPGCFTMVEESSSKPTLKP